MGGEKNCMRSGCKALGGGKQQEGQGALASGRVADGAAGQRFVYAADQLCRTHGTVDEDQRRGGVKNNGTGVGRKNGECNRRIKIR